jgi:hypothetical protein
MVACVCLDLAETRRALASTYARSLGLSAGSSVSLGTVEAQLAKALPQRFRVSLDDLTQRQRLRFSPLEVDRPLSELLGQFKVETPAPGFSLASLFWISGEGKASLPSPYADCLPASPRALENLYYSLESLLTMDREDATRVAVRVLLETAVETGLQRRPVLDVESRALLTVEGASEDNEPSRLALDFAPLLYARQRGSVWAFRPLSEREDIVVEFGVMGRLIVSVMKDGEDTEIQVDPALAYGMLLAREFTSYADVFHEDINGGEPISGGGPSTFLNLRVGRGRGDRYFLMLPRWTTFYDYFVFDRTWRTGMTAISSVSDGFDKDPPELVAGMVLRFLRMVAEVQVDRTCVGVDALTAQRLASPDAAAALEQEWRETRDALIAAAERGGNPSREVAFVDWLTRLMPMACHPWLLPQWLITELLTLRPRLLAEMGRSQARNFELAVLLRQRIQANLGEEWVTPLFETFAEVPDVEIDTLYPAHLQALQQKQRQMLASPPYAQLGPEVGPHAIAVLREMVSEEQQREQ